MSEFLGGEGGGDKVSMRATRGVNVILVAETCAECRQTDTDMNTHIHTHPKSHLRRQERLSPEDNGQTALCVFFHFGSRRRNES